MNANNFNNLKVALVHDFLNQYGGAERVLKVLHEIFPQAPIYTLLYDKEKMKGEFKDADIRTSFLQKFPRFLRKRHKWLLPLMPTAPETFNLRGYDVVVSSSSAFAKGVVVKPKTIHICYCHSPMRYVWDWNEKYIIEQGLGNKRRLAARLLLNYIRMWDRTAADRVDYFVANSKTTQARIKKYYGRESKVIYPPVDVYPSYPRAELLDYKKSKSSALGYSEDFFLIVSRLTPYKKLEVAIEALNKLNLPLVIIGDGSPRYARYLKSIASSKTKFLGWVSDEDIKEYYRNCRAFLFPGEDDFGIAPVEAMAHGRPVLALRKGGAVETVVEGESGEFFDNSTVEVMVDAIRRFISNEDRYNSEEIRRRARRFSKEAFTENIKKTIRETIEDYRKNF